MSAWWWQQFEQSSCAFDIQKSGLLGRGQGSTVFGMLVGMFEAHCGAKATRSGLERQFQQRKTDTVTISGPEIKIYADKTNGSERRQENDK